MFDCNNLHHEFESTKANPNPCTSVAQSSHLDYFQLLSSIVKDNRENIYWNLPLSFVVGIDDGVSLRFHSSVNSALICGHDVKTIFSLRGKAFNERYPMKSVNILPGHVVIFAGARCYLSLFLYVLLTLIII